MSKNTPEIDSARFTVGRLLRGIGRTTPSAPPANAAWSPSGGRVEADTTSGLSEKDVKHTYASCCSFTHDVSSANLWRPGHADAGLPPYTTHGEGDVYRPEVLKTIEAEIERVKGDLRKLSLDIHSHPEVMFKEKCVFPPAMSSLCELSIAYPP
jgi:hypothetical protein